jgi:hypothetical protein
MSEQDKCQTVQERQNTIQPIKIIEQKPIKKHQPFEKTPAFFSILGIRLPI